MTDLTLSKGNLKILGRLFRMHRVKANFSLRGIARSENIAHTLVSDIENAKIYPNAETLKGLFRQVGVKLWTDMDALAEIKADIDKFHDAIYYREHDYARRIFNKYGMKNNRLFYSLLLVDYVLMRLIASSVLENDYDEQEIERLKVFYEHMNESQKQIFNVVQGRHFVDTGDLGTAKKVLLRNHNLNVNTKVSGATYSLLAECAKRTYHAFDAVDYGRQASNLHAEHANLPRKIEIDALVVNVLIDIGRFRDARKMLNIITMTVDENDKETCVTRRYLRFLWSYYYFRLNRPKQALETLMSVHHSEDDNQEPSYHYYKAEILVALDQKARAINTLDEGLANEKTRMHPIYGPLVEIFKKRLMDKMDSTLEARVEELIPRLNHIEDYAVFRQAYRFVIDFFAARQNHEKALELAIAFIETPKHGYETNQETT